MSFETTLKVEGVGTVALAGVGPWYVHEHNRHSFDIRDSTGRTCNPSVTAPMRGGRGVKTNANVVYANKTIPNIIVAAFNAHLGASDGVSVG